MEEKEVKAEQLTLEGISVEEKKWRVYLLSLIHICFNTDARTYGKAHRSTAYTYLCRYGSQRGNL